tara:strand:+ start:1100 stop:2920 length:1821 start_codon:yes stop_codon:yes gene_type:complete
MGGQVVTAHSLPITEPMLEAKNSHVGRQEFQNLLLTPINEGFDPSSDLPLGPWCFIGAEDIFPQWHKLPFVDAIDSGEKKDAIDLVSRWYANDLARKWGEELNRRHNTAHSTEYWRFVLIAWLLTAVQGLLLRFTHIERFVAQHGDQNLKVVLAPIEIPIRPYSFIEFQHHLRRNHRFDFWMSSLIVRRLAPVNWELVEPDPSSSWSAFSDIPDAEDQISNEHYSRLGALSRFLFGRLPFSSVPGTKISKLVFSLYLSLAPKGGPPGRYSSSTDRRPAIRTPDDFDDVLDGFLNVTLPRAYDDQYKEINLQAARLKTYPGRLFIDNFMPSSELRRLEYANALAAGEKLVSMQHGAGYGTTCNNCWSAEFEYSYHAFLTWGWKEHKEYLGNFIPLPSPLLGRFKNKHREKKPELAIVGTKNDLRDVRMIGPRPMEWIKCRESRVEFISELPGRVRERVAYYSYTRGVSDLEDVHYIQQFHPQLNVRYSGLDQEMLGSRLLVLDWPGSTLNIAMAANVPVVCFWDPEICHFVDSARPYFENLSQCGILFDTPIAAADHIDRIWDNVGDWWGSSEVQSARNRWSFQFARTHKFWWWHWAKVLTQLQRAA